MSPNAGKPASSRSPAPIVLPFPRRARAPAVRAVARALGDADQDRLHALRDLLSVSRMTRDPVFDWDRTRPLGDPKAAGERSASALFHALPRAAKHPMVLNDARDAPASEDERWLLRLLRALETGDDSTASSLLAFRVKLESRTAVRFFAAELARSLAAR